MVWIVDKWDWRFLRIARKYIQNSQKPYEQDAQPKICSTLVAIGSQF